MARPTITIVGLGPGSPDALTVGALRALRFALEAGKPIWLRTRIHPTVEYLENDEQITITGTFDTEYDKGASFDEVYAAIVESLIQLVKKSGGLVYAVPGHALFGERSVAMILDRRESDGFDVEIVPAVSYIDTVFAASLIEAGAFTVVDASALANPTERYQVHRSQFNLDTVNILYQVYDRQVASNAKLALLDVYPADWYAGIVSANPHTGAMSVRRVNLAELDWPSQQFDHLTSLVIEPLPTSLRKPDFTTLLDIMAHLRDPNTGCPWDKVQSPETLKRYLIEESYEVIEAIDSGNFDKYAEELGDLLLQVAFHAQLAREEDQFDVSDVIRHIVEKLIRRHPHVFGNLAVSSADEVLVNWEAIKLTEKGYEDRTSILDGIVKALPALMRAQEVSKKAAKAGFEWDNIDGVFAKLDEEVAELREARLQANKERIADEIGDILFTVVNLARFEKIDAEAALQRMIDRFTKRFRHIEAAAQARGINLESMTQSEMEAVWQQAKQEMAD